MYKLLITQGWPKDVVPNYEEQVARLEKRGFEVYLHPKQTDLAEEDLINAVSGISVYMSGSGKTTERVLMAAKKLGLISKLGVGLDAIDIPAATAHKVVVTNAPGSCSEPVAEFTVALMMAAGRRLLENDRLAHSGKWGRTIGRSIFHKTLGILGFGNIGQMVAKAVAGFGMKVIAYTPHPKSEIAKAIGVQMVSFDEVIRQSDFISLHMPHVAGTEYIINATVLSQMKKSAILINTSRGALIDEGALYHALTNNLIAGAALDVHKTEPMDISSPLVKLENCILTTHNAVSTYEGRNRLMYDGVQNVLDILDGKIPPGVVNPQLLKDSPFSLS
jgi:D-3-phosphoglycerate dehydrogenase